MFEISREKSIVKITVDPGLSCKLSPNLYYSCPDEMQAELLKNHLSRRLEKMVEDMRQLEYNAGWEDAKKKRIKRTWFACILHSNKYF